MRGLSRVAFGGRTCSEGTALRKMSKGWAIGSEKFKHALVKEHREAAAILKQTAADSRALQQALWEDELTRLLTRVGGERKDLVFKTDQNIVLHFNSSWALRVRRDDLLTLQVDGTKGSAVATLRDVYTQRAETTSACVKRVRGSPHRPLVTRSMVIPPRREQRWQLPSRARCAASVGNQRGATLPGNDQG